MPRPPRPPRPIQSEDDLAKALKKLLALDARLRPVLALAGTPPLRRRPGGLEGLIRIIVSQQLSTASAEAIWGRVRATHEPFEHGALLRASDADLKAAGLSAPKIRTVRAIAEALGSGAIDFGALAGSTAEEAHAMLTAVHGIGPWTADIYLLFCLGHPDAWPAGDLALQEAARVVFALDRRPSAKEITVLAEA